MMNQAGAASASLSTTTMVSGSHLFNISGFSITKQLPTGKYIMSSPFVAGGYRWAIRYYPNGINTYEDPGIAFTLELQSEGTDVEVRLEFCLVDSNGRPSAAHTMSSFCEFRYESCEEGFSGFITHSDLEESGYLKDDSFVVQCTVGILGSRVSEASASDSHDADQTDKLPPSNLHGQLGRLLEGREGADVTFNVGGSIFLAHRCILAARSPVFRAQFFGPMRGKELNNIDVDDMEPDVFKVLLHYLYTDSLPEWNDINYGNVDSSDSVIMAQHLLAAADQYLIERLKTICAQKLSQTITTDTVATTLALAEQHDCSLLKAACIGFISRGGNLREVLGTDGFKHLMQSCPSIFDEILANVTDPIVLRDLVIKLSKSSITS